MPESEEIMSYDTPELPDPTRLTEQEVLEDSRGYFEALDEICSDPEIRRAIMTVRRFAIENLFALTKAMNGE